MTSRLTLASALAFTLAAVLALSPSVQAQDETPAPQITFGNGELNAITLDGLTRQSETKTFSEVRVDGGNVSTFRANTTALTFPEVTIQNTGWIVLHPVTDGRPNGDMVSGFAYLEAGQNKNVTLQIDHPAEPGDKFLAMLHSDADKDRVFDFVFVEDGINVEDHAIFEGTHMIAHVFEVPE